MNDLSNLVILKENLFSPNQSANKKESFRKNETDIF
jgi:hypothetical protein